MLLARAVIALPPQQGPVFSPETTIKVPEGVKVSRRQLISSAGFGDTGLALSFYHTLETQQGEAQMADKDPAAGSC